MSPKLSRNDITRTSFYFCNTFRVSALLKALLVGILIQHNLKLCQNFAISFVHSVRVIGCRLSKVPNAPYCLKLASFINCSTTITGG